jgi:cell division transport system permease protein
LLAPPVSRLSAAYGSEYVLAGLSASQWFILVGGGALLGLLGAWLAAAYHLRRIEPRA